jgi:ribosomal protein L37AE/L43A
MSFQPEMSHDAWARDGTERTYKVKFSALPSRSHSLICPNCEESEVRSGGYQNEVRCPVCDYALSRGLLEALQHLTTLPEALGNHACEECGHPEMRRLPDGVFHCPGCGSEVLPTISKRRAGTVVKSRGHS